MSLVALVVQYRYLIRILLRPRPGDLWRFRLASLAVSAGAVADALIAVAIWG